MRENVLIFLPNGRALLLEAGAYRAALAQGAKFCATPASSGEPLLDSDQLGAALNLPPTWLEQKARERVIPSLEFGRWRRFRRSEVEAAVTERAPARSTTPAAPTQLEFGF